MYFSNRSKLSRVLSLILVCVLVLSLFAGCKKEEPDETSAPTSDLGLNLAPSTDPTVPPTTLPEAETEPQENMGTVMEKTPIRGTPSKQSAPIVYLEKGARIHVERIEEVGRYVWGMVKEPEEGWIEMTYIQMDDPNATGAVGNTQTPAGSGNATTPSDDDNTGNNGNTGTKGVITGNGVNIRSEASITGKIQGSYNKGDVVTILETKNGWGRTDKGWVSMDYVRYTTGNGGTGNEGTGNNNATGNGSTTVLFKGVVRAKELNIRAAATTNSDRLGGVKYGDRVEILEKDGSWGRIDKGWISLNYVYQDGTTGTNTGKGTITGQGLHIRSGPGTNYDSLGSYSAGTRVTILEQFTYGNTAWGCTNKGWISMDYVDMDGGNNTTNANTGTITDALNVREGAGTNYDIIDVYEAGDVVVILERKNGWGRTDKGWISLNYVDFSDTGSTRTGTVTTGLRVRTGPGTDYDVVGGLEQGDRVTILETEDDWGRISSGWISMDYVDLD